MLAIIAALALNLLWTSAAIVNRLGRVPAWAAMVGFNAFPAAFYIVTPYSEGATLALGLAAFIALGKIAGGSRPPLSARRRRCNPRVPLRARARLRAAVMASRRRTDGRADWWRPLLALPLCLWGQLVTIVGLRSSSATAPRICAPATPSVRPTNGAGYSTARTT